jgi:hypothetical protein
MNLAFGSSSRTTREGFYDQASPFRIPSFVHLNGGMEWQLQKFHLHDTRRIKTELNFRTTWIECPHYIRANVLVAIHVILRCKVISTAEGYKPLFLYLGSINLY